MSTILLLGAPGAGKGTQAKKISAFFSTPHISTGDMLRESIANGSDLGKEVKNVIDSGQLVNDDLMLRMIKNRISLPDCEKGLLLDGFPRTIPQAQGLKKILNIDIVLILTVDEDEVISRITGRLIHPASGRVYHKKNSPPKVAGIDDSTGESLIQRADDKEEVIRHRLENYNNQTAPLISFYEGEAMTKIIEINGMQSVEEVFLSIIENINKVGKFSII